MNTYQRTLDGTVVDASNEQPIAGASIYVRNHHHIGVHADANGNFSIAIPSFIQDDYLVISAVGYEKKIIDLTLLLDFSGAVTLFLHPKTIILKEVPVSGKGHDLQSICKEALLKLPGNYPRKTHYLTGFYRKISTDSMHYTGLVEAIVGIKDPGYQKGPENVKIEVLRARYADNLIQQNTAAMKAGDMLSEHYGVSSAKSLHRFYESNLIRLFTEPYSLFNRRGQLFTFDGEKKGVQERVNLTDVTIDDGDTILHIYSECLVAGRRLDALTIAISLQDKAILEFTRGSFGNMVNVRFKKLRNGRYYPSYVRLITPVLYQAEKKQKYFDIETLYVDTIETDVRRIPKITDAEERQKTFSPAGNPYDPMFWSTYLNAQPRSLDDDILKSLEKRRPLSEQFRHD